ncbi:FtsX-like permease family protein [Gordonia sp. TBRC 11910]|uniref:FtsX-like permease family protein n=1 Tax=Gordonia asplenii TaxID=2725283 RepID=A0A848KT27_9ACTN|nr:FtsX-like permease family protein [Gordonia asplenii]NMO01319.1 FtsX-like permease family protein [Gordonia asplenii]
MMRSIMYRKLLRELRRRAAQTAAIAGTAMLGVLLFVASYDSYQNLKASYAQSYDRMHFADLTAIGGNPDAIARVARAAHGVVRVSTRVQADVPMTIGGAKLVGRVVGFSGTAQSAVNGFDVTAGRVPDGPGQVAVEVHTADTFHLSPGDTIQVFDGTAAHSVRISGVVQSPEYLWPARDRQNVLGDPHAFAVAFAIEPVAQNLVGTNSPNQTLIELHGDPSADELATLSGTLHRAGAVDVQTRDDQPSDAALSEDVNGFSELAVGFPALFLAAAAIAEYILITRLVYSERPIIGTLLAVGARRGAIMRHYLSYGVVVAGCGGILGVVAGAAATSVVTRAYTGALAVPDTVVEYRWGTALIGLALAAATGLVSTVAPAMWASRMSPAQAMRGDGDALRAVRSASHPRPAWHRVPVSVRMALRSLVRSRRRTLATMFGAVLSLVLILVSMGMMTSMLAAIDVQFDQVQREDATVLTASGASDLSGQLTSLKGVAAAEPATLTRVTVAANGISYTTDLTGLEPHTTMHGFVRSNGVAGLPDDGVLAGSAIASKLHVKVGDRVTVTSAAGTAHQVRLAGLVDEPLGSGMYATNATVRAVGGRSTSAELLRFDAGADHEALRAAITAMPGVVAYVDTDAVHDQLDSFLGLFWIFIGVMLMLGAILAFTVIYVTMTVNLSERTPELATLRAAGVSTRRLTAALAAENLVATLAAVPIGLGAGVGAAWFFLRSFDSDLFTMKLSLGWVPLTLAAAAVLGAAGLSQLPAVRIVQRIDMARAIRERSQ